MKLLFLDIDGVLNSQNFYKSRPNITYKNKINYLCEDIDPKGVELINYVLDKTNAKIVISSCWRSDMTSTKKALYKSGLKKDSIVGDTGYIFIYDYDVNTKTSKGIRQPYIIRGTEIDKYLYEHVSVELLYDDNFIYAVVDDDSDFTLKQKKHFVKTNSNVGITKKDADKLIKILNGEC